MPTAAPLTRDLTINGVGLAAVSVIGLVASMIVVGGNATRVIIPWIIVLLVLIVVMARSRPPQRFTSPRVLSLLAGIALLAVVAQITLGGWVSSNYGRWIPHE